MPKLLFPDAHVRSPTAVRGATPRVFKLMRSVSERSDPITAAMADAVQGREITQARTAESSKRAGPKLLFPDASFRKPIVSVDSATFLMSFWNMKQRGEIAADDTPAMWMILMRIIDVRGALRCFLKGCEFSTTERGRNYALDNLRNNCMMYFNHLGDPVTPPFIRKLRTKMVDALGEVAALKGSTIAPVLDPLDASMFLSACETALVVKEEEDRRWRTEPR